MAWNVEHTDEFAEKGGVDPMTGHRPFSELTRTFTPERRARVAAKAACLREAMTLEELRKALALSQEDMAETLTVGQPAVAKLEKRTDMHVSNLRRYVEALGGTLEITARFPDASVVLTNIGEGPP
jgi:DNA-binding XRE family transcriptional regulator